MVGSFKVETHRSQYCILSPPWLRQGDSRAPGGKTRAQGSRQPLGARTVTASGATTTITRRSRRSSRARFTYAVSDLPAGHKRRLPDRATDTRAVGASSLLKEPRGSGLRGRAAGRAAGRCCGRCAVWHCVGVRGRSLKERAGSGRTVSLGRRGCEGAARLLLTRAGPPRPGYSQLPLSTGRHSRSPPRHSLSCFPLSIWPPSDDIMA